MTRVSDALATERAAAVVAASTVSTALVPLALLNGGVEGFMFYSAA
jgi:hypothetical protein